MWQYICACVHAQCVRHSPFHTNRHLRHERRVQKYDCCVLSDGTQRRPYRPQWMSAQMQSVNVHNVTGSYRYMSIMAQSGQHAIKLPRSAIAKFAMSMFIADARILRHDNTATITSTLPIRPVDRMTGKTSQNTTANPVCICGRGHVDRQTCEHNIPKTVVVDIVLRLSDCP